jgi:hypothetical protein
MTPQGVTWVFDLLIRVAQLEIRFITYFDTLCHCGTNAPYFRVIGIDFYGPEQGSIPIEIRVIELEF